MVDRSQMTLHQHRHWLEEDQRKYYIAIFKPLQFSSNLKRQKNRTDIAQAGLKCTRVWVWGFFVLPSLEIYLAF